MSEELVLARDPIGTLTPKERKALEDSRKKNEPRMSPATASNFFQLYVEGYSLEKMLEGNNAWSLGQIADACVRYDWPTKRDTYVDDLHRQAVVRVRKLQGELINHLSDLLAVANTEFRVEMLRYLQNPIDDNLPKVRLKSVREYKELAATIQLLSKIGMPEAAPQQSITVNAAPGSQVAVLNPASGDKAGDLLKRFGEAARAKSDSKPKG